MKKLLPSLFALAATLVTNALQAAPGDIYETDAGSGNVFHFTPNGTKTTALANVTLPSAVAFDAAGSLFVADQTSGNIYKVTPAGVLSTFAMGTNNPQGLAFDETGNLFVAEFGGNLISKFTPAGSKSTFASGLNGPVGLAFDANGNLFASEPNSKSIFKFTPAGTKTTFASGLNSPLGITFDNAGNLYVVDSAVGGPHFLYKFTPDGTRTTFTTLPTRCVGITFDTIGHFFVAAVGNNSILQIGVNAAQSTLASGLNGPQALAIEPAVPAPGVLYAPNGSKVTLVAPNGVKGILAGAGGLTDGAPLGVAFDSKGNLFATDYFGGRIFKVPPGFAPSPFTSGLDGPAGLAVDASDNLYEADSGSGTIFKFTPSGTKTTFASGLNGPAALAFDGAGNLYETDIGNGSIFKFTPNGTKTTLASGLSIPSGLAFDSGGNLYEADFGSGTVFKFTSNGTKSIFASLPQPVGVAVDAGDNIYVVNEGGTVQKYTPAGSRSPFTSGLDTPKLLAFEKPTGRPLNISTRLKVQTGDNVLIAGFIITGTDPKNVLLRGIGPSLSNFGVPGALQDPTLELYAGATKVSANDNWKINDANGASQQAVIQGTGLAPTDDLESAIGILLPPGAYTAILRGKNNTAGVGSVELYDLSQTSTFSNVANISTRGFVDTADNVMIGGFIIGNGDGYGKVLIRAIGPSLTAFGVPNALANPTLELHNGSGALIDSNDDWKSTNQAAIEATGIPPTNDLESAILTTLPAGSYTAIVKGFNGATGVGLVEVYNLK